MKDVATEFIPDVSPVGEFVPEIAPPVPQGTQGDVRDRAFATTLMQSNIPGTDLRATLERNFDELNAMLATGSDINTYMNQAWEQSRAAAVAKALESVQTSALPLDEAIKQGDKLAQIADFKNRGGDYYNAFVAISDEKLSKADADQIAYDWLAGKIAEDRQAQSTGSYIYEVGKSLIPGMSLEIVMQGPSKEEIANIRMMEPGPQKLQVLHELYERLKVQFEGDLGQVEAALDDLFDPAGLDETNKIIGLELANLIPIPLGKAAIGTKAGSKAAVERTLARKGVEEQASGSMKGKILQGPNSGAARTKVEGANRIRPVARASKAVAGKVSAAAAVSPKAAAVAGTTPTRAAQNGLPFPSLIPDNVHGIAPEQIAAASSVAQEELAKTPKLALVKDYSEFIEGKLSGFGKDVLDSSPLTPQEAAKAQLDFETGFKDAMKTRGVVRSFEKVGESTRGATFRVKIAATPKQDWATLRKQFEEGRVFHNDTSYVVKAEPTINAKNRTIDVEYEVQYTRRGIDTNPDLSNVKVNQAASWLKQAVDRFKFLPSLVKNADIAGRQQDRLLHEAQEIVYGVTKKLDKEQAQMFEALLKKAESREADLSVDEILGETGGDWRVASAYYKYRATTDQLHGMMNRLRHAQRTFDGWFGVETGVGTKNGRFLDVDKAFRKIGEDGEERALTFGRVNRAGNPTVETLTKKQLRKMLDENPDLKLVEIDSPINIKSKKGQGNDLTYMLTSQSRDFRVLPHDQIPYRKAYIPKIYKDALFMVSRNQSRILNGRTIKDQQVKAFFDSEKEAQQYIQEEAAKLGLKPEDAFEVGDLRRQSVDRIYDDKLQNIFGLFADPRTTADITYGLKREVPRTLSPVEALERNLGYVSRMEAFTNFRMENIQRFQNLVKQAEKKGIARFAEEGNWRSPLVVTSTGDKTARALMDMQNYLKDILGIRAVEEKHFDGVVQNITDWMEGKTWADTPIIAGKEGTKLRRVVDSMRSGSLISAAKTASYHGLLGMFNASQLVVQAMGFSAAFALEPHRALKYLYQYQGLYWTKRAVQAAHLVSPAQKQAYIRKIGARMGFEPEEFAHLFNAYQRSGLWDAVRANADMSYIDHGFSMTPGLLRKVAGSGLMFIREGERFSHGYAFLKAANDWKKATGKTFKELDDKSIIDVVDKSTDYVFKLSAANKARWQNSDILALPTQFFQITAKSFENLLPEALGGTHRFTPGEKSKMFAGQMVMFGAAAVPFSAWWSVPFAKYVSWMAGDETGQVDPKVASAIQTGGIGMLTSLMFGDSFDLSKRGSSLSGLEQMLDNLSEGSVKDAFLGAAGTVPNRALQQVPKAWNRVISIGKGDLWDESPQILVAAVNDILRISSSWNNKHKAELASSLGYLVDGNSGRALDNATRAEINGLMLGFQPSRLSIYRAQTKDNKEAQAAKTELVTALAEMELEYMAGPATPERRKFADVRRALMLTAALGNNQEAIVEVEKAVTRKINGNEKHADIRKRFWKFQTELDGYGESPSLESLMIDSNPDTPQVEDIDLGNIYDEGE